METLVNTDIKNAIRNGDIEALKKAINTDSTRVNQKDEKGFTPLILAAYYDQQEVAQVLIGAGAVIDDKDASGNTALMGACFKGYKSTVELLLKNGAEVNTQNHNGATALTFACSFNQEAIAKLLLQYGADKDLKDKRGNTAFDQARMQGLKWVNDL